MVSNPYQSLQDRLGITETLPYTAHWSAAQDFLQLLTDHCLENMPTTIIECSSGLSTLVLARCCQLNKSGHVFSLENGIDFADATRRNLQHFGLASQATVIHAPLKKHTLDKTDFDWYSIDDLPENKIDLLVIDGPPGYIQHHSRYPALPLLHQRLSDQCTVFLDDAERDEEKEIVALWQEQFPFFKHTFIDTERGCSILRSRNPG